MMENRSYLVEWISLEDKSLLRFFNNLSQKGWDEMVDDCVNEDMSFLGYILNIPKGDTLFTYLLPIWAHVLPETRIFIKNSLDSLLKSAEKDVCIQLLLYIAAFLEIALNESSIENVARNRSLTPLTRAIAADMLSVNMRFCLNKFWDSVNLAEENFFLSGYISFFQSVNPIKGLEQLQLLKVQPENLSEYEIPVKGALVNVLRHPSWQKRLVDMLASGECLKWVKRYICEMVETYEYLEPLSVKLSSRKLKVGISPFPDLVALDYLARRKIFDKYGLKIKVFYYEWSELFTKLEEGKIDVILANKEVYEEKNREQKFRYWFDFNKNVGLRVITRAPFEKKKGQSCMDLLKLMRWKKIAVASDSDHYKVICDLVEDNDLELDCFSWVKVQGMSQAFNTFWQDSSISFYVGGMLETEYAIKHLECVEFIPSEIIYSRLTAQYNGCVSMADTNKRKEIRLFEDIWYAIDITHLINYDRLYGLWKKEARQFREKRGEEYGMIDRDRKTGQNFFVKCVTWRDGYA